MKTPKEKAIDYCMEVEGEIHQPYIDAFLAGYKAANEWISVEDELPKQITNTVEDKEKQIKKNIIKWLGWHIDEINNNDLSQEIPQEDRKYNEQILKEISECIEWLKKN